jgi:hypothetical protein
MSGYVPSPASAKSLHVLLGYVATSVNNSVLTSPVTSNLNAINIVSAPGTLQSFLTSDVGCIVQVFGCGPPDANGNPTPLWTTIASVASVRGQRSATITDAASIGFTGVWIVLYRELLYEGPSSYAPYVLQGSMRFQQSITNTGTFEFTVISNTGSITAPPVVGQPVLLIDDEMGDVFGGSITQTTASNIPGSALVKTECQCESWDQIFRRRLLMMTGAFALGNATQNILESVPGQVIFVLDFQPTAIYSITLGGVAQTFALAPTPGVDFQWTLWDPWLYQVSGAPPSEDNPLVINYQGQGATDSPPSYSNLSAGEIVSTLALLLWQEGISLGTIIPGPMVDLLSLTKQDTIGSAFDTLCKYISTPTGGTYLVQMGARRQLNFTLCGVTNPAPWNIDVDDQSDENVLIQIKQLITREKFADAALVSTNTLAGGTVTLQFWGTGSTENWNTPLPIGAAPTITRTTNVGVPGYGPIPPPIVRTQTVKLLSTAPVPPPTFDWYWNPSSTGLTRAGALGNWLASFTYGISDIVNPSLGGNPQYISLQAGNIGHWPQLLPFDGSGRVGYSVGDIVTSIGTPPTWICIQAITADEAAFTEYVPQYPSIYWSPIEGWENLPTTYDAFPSSSHVCSCFFGSRVYKCIADTSGAPNNLYPDEYPTYWQDITDEWWQYRDLQSNEYLTVTYAPETILVQQYVEASVAAQRAAIEGGTGEYDAYEDTSSSQPFVLLPDQSVAQIVAATYDQLTQEVTVATYRSGLMPAQSITVNLPEIQAVGSFVVQSVELTDEDNLSLWKVTIIAGAVIGDWKNAIKAMSSGGTTASGSGAVSAASGVTIHGVPADY